VTFDGEEQTVDVILGGTLMEGAVKNGVRGIDADCGGNCYCGTCRAHICTPWRETVGQRGEYERQLIESIGETDPAVRLCCQVTVTEDLDGLIVRLPETQR
jgi:2Fe-2S ferredoxin